MGRQVGVVVNRELVTIATVQTPVTELPIQGDFTLAEAEELARAFNRPENRSSSRGGAGLGEDGWGRAGSNSSSGSGIFRMPAGTSAPMLTHKVAPEYTEEARKAKKEGTVMLGVNITPEGVATNIKVQRGLGMGLDEKAVEAVKQWRFKPGQRDGKPVTVTATIEVNFRL